METKICEGCKQEKNILEFNKANGGHGHGSNRYPHCKECCALRRYTANQLAKEHGLQKTEWNKKFKFGQRQRMVEQKFEELLKNPPKLNRFIRNYDIDLSMQKGCISCHLAKPLSEFNDSRNTVNEHGKQKYCTKCHRLKHHAYIVAAHADGMTRRQWNRLVSKPERMEKVNSIFAELVKKSLEEQGLCANLVKKENCSVNDPLLNEIRARNKKELINLNNKQTEIEEGFVYAITNPAFIDSVKIGSAMDYERRLSNFQTYDPERRFNLEYRRYFANREQAEKWVHKELKDFRINDKGEWFRVTIDDAIDTIESCSCTSEYIRQN